MRNRIVMRRNLLFLLFASLLSFTAYADPEFDSMFVKSDVMIYGLVIRHEIASNQPNNNMRICTVDVVVNTMCSGGRSVRDPAALPYPGDTIRQLIYFRNSTDDTLSSERSYVLLLRADSAGWKLTDENFETGIYHDYDVFGSHCNVLYVLPDSRNPHSTTKLEMSLQKGWTTIVSTDAGGNLVSVRKHKWRNSKLLTRFTEINSQGDEVEKYHSRYTNGGHTVKWTFRKDGKRCLKRSSVWIID
jgi:hypothetical protein